MGTRVWISRFCPAQDVAASADPSLRLCRLNALSTCHHCPCTRLKNRRFICRLYFVFDHFRVFRPRLTGITPCESGSSRISTWKPSESYPPSKIPLRQRVRPCALLVIDGPSQVSLRGPFVTSAETMKWLARSHTAESFGQRFIV